MENLINGITHTNKGFNVNDLTKTQMLNMNEVYICPSFLCNLKCPHCTLKNLPNKMDIKSILETLKFLNENSGQNLMYDLFGGEPLLLPENIITQIFSVINKKKFVVSTNLLNLQDFHIPYFKQAMWVNVSWNPQRFTDEQYKKCLENIEILHKHNIKINAMVTLTDDLILNYTPNEFYQKIILKWHPYSLDLDYFIGPSQNINDKIDDWLVNLYEIWDIDTKFNMVENILTAIKYNTKYKDCSNHYTILPSGNIKYGCAYWDTDVIKINCLMCELYNFCNGGCKLETKCK